MQVITVALSKINQRTNSFSKVFVWVRGTWNVLCKQYLCTVGHEIPVCLTKDICRMDIVDGLF